MLYHPEHDSDVFSCLDHLILLLRDNHLESPYEFTSVPISQLPSSAQKALVGTPEIHRFFFLLQNANSIGESRPEPPSLLHVRNLAFQKFIRTLEGSARALARGLIGSMEKASLPITPFTTTSEEGYDTHLDAESLRDSQHTKEEHITEVRDILFPEWRAHIESYIEELDAFRWFEETYPRDPYTNSPSCLNIDPDEVGYATSRSIDWYEQSLKDEENTSDFGNSDGSDIARSPQQSPYTATTDTTGDSEYQSRDDEVTSAITIAVDHLQDLYHKIIAERNARVNQVRGGPLSPLGLFPDSNWVVVHDDDEHDAF